MIDARRWVLVEAWLSLGLRIEWCPSYDENRYREQDWQTDEDGGERFVYTGQGVWQVADRDRLRRGLGYSNPKVPDLSTETLHHELAHYLMASDEQRGQVNFGMTRDSAEAEERALVAEKVIDAVLTGANRIAELALLGGRRG